MPRILLPLVFVPLLSAADGLPEDRGAAGLHQALKKMQTNACVLHGCQISSLHYFQLRPRCFAQAAERG